VSQTTQGLGIDQTHQRTGELFTVGHSTHPAERLVELLVRHRVTAVCDVRSTPYSRRNPQFNRETLAATLVASGIDHLFLGRELGARSEDPGCYVHGQVRYDRLAATVLFREGLERVLAAMQEQTVALMCAEAEPLACHRTILVCRHLRGRVEGIAHIHADGRLERHGEAEQRLVRMTKVGQGELFEGGDVVERAYERQGKRIGYRDPGAVERRP